jgi:hypothetical protein
MFNKNTDLSDASDFLTRKNDVWHNYLKVSDVCVRKLSSLPINNIQYVIDVANEQEKAQEMKDEERRSKYMDQPVYNLSLYHPPYKINDDWRIELVS